MGVKCEVCEGKGYKIRAVREGGQLVPAKIWCEVCKGTGQTEYEGKHDGVAWERE